MHGGQRSSVQRLRESSSTIWNYLPDLIRYAAVLVVFVSNNIGMGTKS
jgi:hypothetical protein